MPHCWRRITVFQRDLYCGAQLVESSYSWIRWWKSSVHCIAKNVGQVGPRFTESLRNKLRELCINRNTSYKGLLRIVTRPGKPGKPGKMRVHLENLEISWNFEKFNKNHGKMIWDLEKTWWTLKIPPINLLNYLNRLEGRAINLEYNWNGQFFV